MFHILSGNNKVHTSSHTPTIESGMYINNPTSVILDGVDGKCILTGVDDGPMAFPTPTSSATSSTSQEESSSDGGSILAIDDVDKSLSYNHSETSSASNSYNGSSLYSVQLPGFGKVLAVNSEKSCDLDVLYEEQKRAIDVDAFVDADTDDEEEEHDFPLYPSNLAKVEDSIPEGIFAQNNTSMYDIEANHTPSSMAMETLAMDALSLDPNSDPFAQRVGKKLSWRNVNMTLVCYFHMCLIHASMHLRHHD
jgi:hypothetical protein